MSRGLAGGLALALALPATAQTPAEPKSPVLGAGSGFFMRWQQRSFAAIQQIPIDDLRDAVVWNHVETTPDTLDWSHPTSVAPQRIHDETDADISLLLLAKNRLHDDDTSPVSDAAIAAFARFVEGVAQEYPFVTSLEIGNEFNGSFTWGDTVTAMSPVERAALHARYLKEAAARPGVEGTRLVGGAAHSIAAGYLWAVLDAGAADAIDAIALHPYTTPPERFPAQIDVLRRHPDMAGLGIEVTEFGTKDRTHAADYLWKYHCQMARAGVDRAVWYPLETRGDDYVPVFDTQSRLTPVGLAYRYIQENASDVPVTEIAPDPFTYGCLFDEKTAVIWGAPRDLTLAPGLAAYTADMQARPAGGLRLDRDSVIVVTSETPFDPATALTLGPSPVVADSFDTFTFPDADGTETPGPGGFERFLILADGRRYPYQTCPGQTAPGRPWTPHLCLPAYGWAYLTSQTFVMGGTSEHPAQMVHRFTAPESMTVTANISLELLQSQSNGIGLTLRKNGTDEGQTRQIAYSGSAEEIVTDPIALAAGDQLDIVIDPNGRPASDIARYRFRLNRDDG